MRAFERYIVLGDEIGEHCMGDSRGFHAMAADLMFYFLCRCHSQLQDG